MEKLLLPFEIELEVILLSEADLSKNFVAIASEIEDGECSHSGLIICFEKQITFFHYTGKTVELKNITSDISIKNDTYIKLLNIIVEDEVISFLGHCEKLKTKGIHPQYGFVFNNSYYDSTTKESFLINAEFDITTCVGFCIKVIRGFLFNNDEYLKLDDWNSSSLQSTQKWLIEYMNKYLLIYAKENGISVENLYSKSELKRITPSELLSSGFFNDLPISKVSIETIRPNLESFISKKVA
jgi:hypothetical protein